MERAPAMNLGTIGETYLSRRGITLPEDIRDSGALGCHAACPVKIGGVLKRKWALLAKLIGTHSNTFCGIQATFLNADGEKDPEVSGGSRRTYGSAKGAVCKLTRDEDVTTVLGIGEGIETTLSMLQIPE